jgi:hypothetical protein
MAAYKLTLTADLRETVGPTGFFNAFAKDGQNRNWMVLNDQTWQPAHSNNYDKSDSDKWGPSLRYSKSGSKTTDTVAFQIYFAHLPNNVQLSDLTVNVYLVFGRMGRTNATNTVASPFVDNGNARCVTVANNGNGGGLTAGDGVSLCTTNMTPAVNTSIVTGSPTLKFEFSIAVTVSWTDNSGTTITYQYGYDPELDLDVGA